MHVPKYKIGTKSTNGTTPVARKIQFGTFTSGSSSPLKKIKMLVEGASIYIIKPDPHYNFSSCRNPPIVHQQLSQYLYTPSVASIAFEKKLAHCVLLTG